MEFLDSKVKIDLPALILKHLNRTLHQDENDHSLVYMFLLGTIFEAFDIPIFVWKYETTKDVLSRVRYFSLPVSMKWANTLLQQAYIALEEKTKELEDV